MSKQSGKAVVRWPTLRLSLGVLLCTLLLQSAGAQSYSPGLMEIVERLSHDQLEGHEVLPGTRVHEPALVGAFYDGNEYEFAWTDLDYAGQMVAYLGSSVEEGLVPADYHHGELMALHAGLSSADDTHRTRFDILLTDGLLLYVRHLLQGKVDPRTMDSSWNYSRRALDPQDVARSLSEAIASRSVAARIDGVKMDRPFYTVARARLKHYRELAAREDFVPLPTDVVLHPGDEHDNVPALRRRLVDLGFLDPAQTGSRLFDGQVETAVRELQTQHGLDTDGVVGRQSYALLNLSYADKVDMLRVNLDRMRWISNDLSDENIIVNIAGFELYYLRDGKLVWETPVMVGNIATRTPIFQAPLRYLEFNPTWNAPRSLVRRSVFPKISADPNYAVEKGYRLYDAQGKSVDPLTLDYSQYTAGNFPYRVVQMPGPANAMGQVKFMFPNRHAVYLHDTPSRELFSRSQRAFSAGCIRVKNPLELARRLLDDPDNWSAQQIQDLLDSGDPQQVARVQRPIDVLLMYWTISPTGGDRLQFHHDIYGLDPAALAALDAPPGSSAH